MKKMPFTYLVAISLAGCLPSQLDKYRHNSERLTPSEDRSEASQPRSAVQVVGKHTYRVNAREQEAWEGVLTVLLANYNVAIVDRATGLISTEWDTFYSQGSVFRNKVTTRVQRSGQWVEVTVRNNVEKLRDGGSVWLPAEDPGQEVSRIVVNLAKLLNHTAPVELEEALSGVVKEKTDAAL